MKQPFAAGASRDATSVLGTQSPTVPSILKRVTPKKALRRPV
jgi:hypothetical protein